jgi:hypothetical protein
MRTLLPSSFFSFSLVTLSLATLSAGCGGSTAVLQSTDAGTDGARASDGSLADGKGPAHDGSPSSDASDAGTSPKDGAKEATSDAAAGCSPDASATPTVPNGIVFCTTNADCRCPEACLPDTLFVGSDLKICQVVCNTTADCVDPTAVCLGGGCEQNACGSSDAGTNGTPFGLCNAAGAHDGTCIPAVDAVDRADDACQQGGTAANGAACSTVATRANPDALCIPGSACVSTSAGDTAGTCGVVCELGASPSPCPTGTQCAATQGAFTSGVTGACLPLQGNGATACVDGISDEFSPCSSTAACGCIAGASVACTEDDAFFDKLYLNGFFGSPFGTKTFCERQCSTNSDCPGAYETCTNSACTVNFCGSADAGSGFGGDCDAGGAAGVCTPVWEDYEELPDNPNGAIALAYGVCLAGGTIADGQSCQPAQQDRTQPSTLCVSGDVCFPKSGGGGVCVPTCLTNDTEANSGICDNGKGCSEDALGGFIGVCCDLADDGHCL